MKGAGEETDLAWCAADLHLENDDPVLQVFLEWVEEFRRSGAPALVLLGDLFQVWIGLESTQGEEQKRVLDAMALLVRGGKTVVYLPGNRDYFVEEVEPRTGLVVAERWDLDSPAGKVRFEHGDLVNTSDDQYLRWRRFSRTRLTRLLFKALPARAQLALARRLEKRFARTNLSYKAYDPAAELSAWAQKAAEEGIASAVLGHFHKDEERTAAGVRVRLLPQFRDEGLHLRIAADGSWRLLPAAARGA